MVEKKVSVWVVMPAEVRKAAMLRAITDDRKLASLVRDWVAQYGDGATEIVVYR